MASLPGSSMEIFISNWESIIFKLNPTLIAIIIIFVLVAILVPISGFLVCCCKVRNILFSILDYEYFNFLNFELKLLRYAIELIV